MITLKNCNHCSVELTNEEMFFFEGKWYCSECLERLCCVDTDKLSVEKLQEIRVEELKDFNSKILQAELKNQKLQEQLYTAENYIEHAIGTIKHDGHLGTIQTDWILPYLEKVLAAIENEGSGDE